MTNILPLPKTGRPLYLQQIKLTNFKNYEQQMVDCAPRLNAFVGRNGMGKTNLLDAIYYLCMGKSYFGLNDQYIARHETGFFRLEGSFRIGERTERMIAKVQIRQRKVLEHNGAPYDRLSDHVGRYPVVIVVPDDTALVTEGSEVRRRFMDNTLSQLDPLYLQQLIIYNKVLKQRNALLKDFGGRPVSGGLLEVYDQQLTEPAAYIYQVRSAFMEAFTPLLQAAHQAIVGEAETVELLYRSQLAEAELDHWLVQNRDKDRVLERTTAGIHRDDLVFQLAEQPLKRLGSQGQVKSFVLALKLAQYAYLRAGKDRLPLLLLDDIFDKLDPSRVEQLLTFILAEDFGQVFISDTDPARIKGLLAKFATDHRVYHIADGIATPYE